MSDDVIIVNQGFTTRTSSTGRTRTTIEVESEPLVHNLDPRRLGAPVAAAIAEYLRDSIKGIITLAAPATIAARKAALRAFEGQHAAKAQRSAAIAAKKATQPTNPTKGHAPKFGPKMAPKFGPHRRPASTYPMQRYSGGRLGAMPPAQSDALFNDSGRLAKSIVASAREDDFIVNVAANRFDPNTLNKGKHGSPQGALQSIITRLREHVPAFADPSLMLNSIPVRRAIDQGIRDMVKKSTARVRELELETAKRLFEVIRAVVEIAA